MKLFVKQMRGAMMVMGLLGTLPFSSSGQGQDVNRAEGIHIADATGTARDQPVNANHQSASILYAADDIERLYRSCEARQKRTPGGDRRTNESLARHRVDPTDSPILDSVSPAGVLKGTSSTESRPSTNDWLTDPNVRGPIVNSSNSKAVYDGFRGMASAHGVLTEPAVKIEKTHNSIQGMHELVDVTLESGSFETGGFDFLIAYDESALTLQFVLPGPAFYDPAPLGCEWEYFTYRFGPFGNCGDECPGGLVRIVGIAETNNGPYHPDCFFPDSLPAVVFTLDFLVTNDRTFECMYVPVRFFWIDCGDNTMSSKLGDSLFVSRFVYEIDGVDTIDITDTSYGFPTYFGVQTECLEGGGPDKPVPLQFIDFVNGGVDIACAESLDIRGDINLNGIPYEIADAVLFTNYFIYGLAVFVVNRDGQIMATDVNADGLTLTLGDLVFLIRIIIGLASPIPKLTPVTAGYSVENGVVSVDAEMGAACVVAEGNVIPTLLANNMEMKHAYDSEEDVTRILVFSMEEGQTFAGAFLDVRSQILSIEMATYEGAPVTAERMPTGFALHQNYPNPFNPMTTISFTLPSATDFELVIYNLTGREVSTFTGHSEPGLVKIEWDASTCASGVYFYKLTADNTTSTRKMVLLK